MVSVYAAVMCKVVECTEGGEGVCLPIGGDREFQAEGMMCREALMWDIPGHGCLPMVQWEKLVEKKK